jgi:hypothetical protein
MGRRTLLRSGLAAAAVATAPGWTRRRGRGPADGPGRVGRRRPPRVGPPLRPDRRDHVGRGSGLGQPGHERPPRHDPGCAPRRERVEPVGGRGTHRRDGVLLAAGRHAGWRLRRAVRAGQHLPDPPGRGRGVHRPSRGGLVRADQGSGQHGRGRRHPRVGTRPPHAPRRPGLPTHADQVGSKACAIDRLPAAVTGHGVAASRHVRRLHPQRPRHAPRQQPAELQGSGDQGVHPGMGADRALPDDRPANPDPRALAV